MFNFSLGISIPLRKRPDIKDEDIWYKTWSVTKNKAFEIQTNRSFYDWCIFNISCYITRFQCHSGIKLELTLFNRMVLMNFYDKRHWDYEKGQWEE